MEKVVNKKERSESDFTKMLITSMFINRFSLFFLKIVWALVFNKKFVVKNVVPKLN